LIITAIYLPETKGIDLAKMDEETAAGAENSEKTGSIRNGPPRVS
jgi:hypothetical protein